MDSYDISDDDWQLLFGNRDSQRNKSCRAAEVRLSNAELSNLQMSGPTQTYKKVQTVTKKTTYNSQPLVEDVDHLIRYVMLVAESDVITAFHFLVEFFQASYKNFKILHDTFSIIGFVFDETHFAQFRVQIFSHEHGLGVCLHVLEGDAQEAVSQFWSKLQDALAEKALIKLFRDVVLESDDEFFADSCDEEEEEVQFSLPIPGLQKAEPFVLQPNYVNNLMEEMQDQSFMLHALMILSWNCQMQQNLEVISGAGQAQQLFDLIIACLVATATDFCLPVARSASLLVSKLVETGAIQISEEQYRVLVNTIVQWTIQNNNGDLNETVTQSEEIALLLTSKLPELARDVSNSECTQQLHEVYCHAPFQSVRQNIAQLVQ